MQDRLQVWFAALLAILVVVCFLFASTASPAPYAYDESDYMFAGTQGIWANYTDQSAMSLSEFVSKGLELSRDHSRRVSMSQYVRSLGDISFYRHFHGPLYAYWIGLCHAVGARTEAAYRGSGVLLHGLGAIAIFWLFARTFPQFPSAAAFVASLMFLMNRTTLSAGTMITQHIVYEVVSVVALFALARYLQTQQIRWWYGTTALLAAAFAAVEISVVLMGVVLICVVIAHWEDRRKLLGLLGKGTLCFLVTLLVIWPKGVLQLNVVKGYLYLAYIAVYRKTFSPIGPMELWGFKIRTYPWEFILPLAVLLGVLLLWRKLGPRMAILPFLVYAILFVGVTMVVTAPYTYYHGSLLAATAVLTGVAYGELSSRIGTTGRVLMLGLIAGSLVVLDIGFYKETKQVRDTPVFTRAVLDYLQQADTNSPLYASYVLVPTVHYYHPNLPVVGYDADWSAERLAEESMAAAPSRVLCAVTVCEQLTKLWPAEVVSSMKREPAGRLDGTGEPVYALSLKRL